MRISDWSSDVCSSDLILEQHLGLGNAAQAHGRLALADPQALGRSGLGIAQGDEAADALLDAVVEHPREDKVQPRDAAAGDPVLAAVQHIAVAALVGPRNRKSVVSGGGVNVR